jgi:hypothetical protein
VLDKAVQSLVVEDYLEMRGEHDVEIFLHGAPEGACAAHGRRGPAGARRPRDPHPLARHAGGAGAGAARAHATHRGWVSRRFDRREPAPTLVWRARIAGDCVLRTVIDCRSDYAVQAMPPKAGQLAHPS